MESLPAEQHPDLLEIARQRLASREQEWIVDDIREAEADRAAGRSRVATVEEIMREIAE